MYREGVRPFPLLLLLVLSPGCKRQAPVAPAPPPTIILWAWDRAEDLRFLQPGEAEVAALMQTVYLRNGNADPWRRKLPLFLPEGIEPIYVTRFESDGSALPSPELTYQFLSPGSRHQIDFDVRQSQLPWYRELLALAANAKLNPSITSVLSACLDSPPLAGLPPEIVPMLFRLGPQRNSYLAKLQSQGDFAPECRGSFGISVDEPLPWLPPAKRVYVFNPQPWTRESFDQIRSRLR